MLQVKDPQEVFDENIRPLFVQAAKDIRQELDEEALNTPYSIFILGEMYGTISTCLAQNIPIPKELWDMPVVKSFVRGDTNDVIVVDDIGLFSQKEAKDATERLKTKGIVRGDVDNAVVIESDNKEQGFYQSQADERKDLLEQVADIVRAEMPGMKIEVISCPDNSIAAETPHSGIGTINPEPSVENKGLIIIP
jgi:hypothetical protein